MRVPRIYYAILTVSCIGILCIGMAGATGTEHTPRNGTHIPGHLHPGLNLTAAKEDANARTGHVWANATGSKPGFMYGNTTAGRTWPGVNRTAHPEKTEKGTERIKSVLTNATRQQEMTQRYAQRGIDTTGLESAFASGNLSAMMAWMDANRPVHHAGETSTLGNDR